LNGILFRFHGGLPSVGSFSGIWVGRLSISFEAEAWLAERWGGGFIDNLDDESARAVVADRGRPGIRVIDRLSLMKGLGWLARAASIRHHQDVIAD